MTSETYYILRAKDVFGDSWPLSSLVSGITGRHSTLTDAQQAAQRFKTDKAFRRELRLLNGWQQGTIRSLQIQEIVTN